jgi:hypothetical protein
MKIERLAPKPEFDLIFFLEMSGLNRIEQDLLDAMESGWTDWLDRVQAFCIAPEKAKKGDGYLLVYLPESVEQAVEAAWETSPQHGEAFHNLAITLVMASAQNLMPELLESCAPLPKPSKAMQESFEKVGVVWNPQIDKLDRQYALFTLMPYKGGCELCTQSASCPNSTLAQ